MNERERNEREWANPANWRGPFYFGERDSRILVRKRRGTGRGWTFNLASTGGRLTFTALIAAALAAVALAVALGGRGA
jgi:uncharacterized membrane protein